MAVIYKHRRLDNNQVFYVGIGKDLSRPYSTKNRNRYWENIANAVGYGVEVLEQGLTYDQAKNFEKYLIDIYGRKDLKSGHLVNMTDGGDGVERLIVSEETRKLISERTKEGMKKVDLTGSNNPMFGRVFTAEHRAKIGSKSLGRPNVMKGKKNPKTGLRNKKKVIDNNTGMVFNSATEAAQYFGINRYTLIGKLNGWDNNKTSLRYL